MYIHIRRKGLLDDPSTGSELIRAACSGSLYEEEVVSSALFQVDDVGSLQTMLQEALHLLILAMRDGSRSHSSKYKGVSFTLTGAFNTTELKEEWILLTGSHKLVITLREGLAYATTRTLASTESGMCDLVELGIPDDAKVSFYSKRRGAWQPQLQELRLSYLLGVVAAVNTARLTADSPMPSSQVRLPSGERGALLLHDDVIDFGPFTYHIVNGRKLILFKPKDRLREPIQLTFVSSIARKGFAPTTEDVYCWKMDLDDCEGAIPIYVDDVDRTHRMCVIRPNKEVKYEMASTIPVETLL